MKKVKSIKNLSGEEILDILEILFVGDSWVRAKFKGYGFTKTFGPWNGYTIEFEN